jgi:signal peptidase II
MLSRKSFAFINTSALFFFALLIVDQITKTCAIQLWKERVFELKSWLQFGYEPNEGLAWGIGASTHPLVRYFFSGLMLLGIAIIAHRTILDWCKNTSEWIIYGRSLIIIGGISNLIDRFIYGSVIDFIQVFIGDYRLSVFNLADVYIILGICILLKKASHDSIF